MEELDTTIYLQKISDPLLESALAGESGITVTNNYRGKEVLTAYAPLKLRGLDWVLLTDIEVQEAYAPLRKLQTSLFDYGSNLSFI